MDGNKAGIVETTVTNTPGEEGAHVVVRKQWWDYGDESCRGPVTAELYHTKDSGVNRGDVEGRFVALAAVNPDVVGWLTVEGTAIDYPVVQGEDNDYYIYVDFYGKSSKRGAIFLDYRITAGSRVSIIYGHHMKDGTMFHDLYAYEAQAYRDEHSKITMFPLEGNAETYHVVDVVYWDVTEIHEHTLFEYVTAMDNEDGKILALVTCDNTVDDARLVVIARQRYMD